MALDRVGEDFKDFAQQLRRQGDVVAAAPKDWVGEAADGAADRRRVVVKEIEDAAIDSDAVALAVFKAVTAVQGVARGVTTVREFARARELRVGADGTVGDAAAEPTSYATQAEAIDYASGRQRAINECVDMMEAVLRKAEQVDRDLATVLANTVPGHTPSKVAAAAAKAAAAGGGAVAGPPGTAAAAVVGWWSCLTPVEQQWVLAHHPEWLKGAYGGGDVVLPAAASGAAGNAGWDGNLTVDGAGVRGRPPGAGYADDPVNVAAGNFVETEVDLSFDGLAAGLTFERTYNSRSPVVGAFGHGWSSWVEVVLEETATGARVRLPEGRMLEFVSDGEGFAAALGAPAWLYRADGGGFTLDLGQGRRWVFDAEGLLVSTDSGPGSRVAFERDAEHRLVRMRHELGRWVDLSWWHERVVGLRDDAGRTLEYTFLNHTPLADLQTQASQGGVAQGVVPEGAAVGVLVAVSGSGLNRRYEVDAAGRVAGVIDADGVVLVRNEYDLLGRVLAQRAPHGRVSRYVYLSGHVTVVHDGDGGRADTWISDNQGRLVAVIDTDGQRSTRAYDAVGNAVEVVARSGGRVVQEFTERGLLSRRVEADGSQVRIEYDDLDRVVVVTSSSAEGAAEVAGVNAGESRVGYSYEGAERTPSVVVDGEGGVTRLGVAGGLVGWLEDPDGVRLDLAQNEFGELVEVRDGVQNVARLVRDRVGRVVAAVSPSGRRTGFSYGPTGVLTERVGPDGAVWRFSATAAGRPAGVVDPTGVMTRVAYGEHGDRDSITEAFEQVTHYDWDDVGNLTGVALPDGSRWEFGYDTLSRRRSVRDANGQVWRRGFDVDGNLTEVVDPLGVRVGIEVDAAGRVVGVQDGGGRLGATYDGLGRLATESAPDGGVTTLSYDRCGRPVVVVDPAGGRRSYTYSPGGKVTSITDADGRVTQFAYDACGRTQAITQPGGARYEVAYTPDGQVESWAGPDGTGAAFVYDAAGRVVRAAVPGQGVTYRDYDAAGRVVQVVNALFGRRRFVYDEAGQLVAAVDARGGVTRYAYDAVGRLVETVNPVGGVTRRRYDPSGRLVEVIDPLGRLTSARYDAAGRQVEQCAGDGSRLAWTFDASGREESMTAVDADGHQVRYTAHRDVAGRRLRITSTAGDDDELVWDAVGNLVSRRRGGLSLGWVYDAVGRRNAFVHPDGTRTSYAYDTAGRLVGLSHPGVGRAVLTRDEAGRVTAACAPGLSASWAWGPDGVVEHTLTHSGRTEHTQVHRDETGRVNGVVRDGAATAFAYDAAGQLTGISGPAGTQTFGYDAAGRLSEHHSTPTADHGTPAALSESVASGPGVDGPGDSRPGGSRPGGTGPGGSGSGLEQGVTRCTFDVAGQLLTQTVAGARTTFTYDGAGRRRTATGPHGTRTYSWDARGYLTKVTTLPVGLSQSSSTGPIDGSVQRRLHVDALGELARVDALPIWWDTASGLTAPLAGVGQSTIVGAGATTALHTEAQSTWLPVDWRGQPTPPPGPTSDGAPSGGASAAGFDPWRSSTSGVGGLQVGDGGDLLIDDLVWLRARAYTPGTHSFLSLDPLDPVTGSGWAGNPYAYAGNNPVVFTDPTGLRPATDTDVNNGGGGITGWWNKAKNFYHQHEQTLNYLAAGAMTAAGVALMFTGVGSPVGAALVLAASGAFLGAGTSTATQQYSNGSVNWGQVGTDAAIGAAAGLAGGGAGAVGAKALAHASPLTRGVIVGATGNIVQGATTRAASGHNPLDAGSLATDAITGALPGGTIAKLTSASRAAKQFARDTSVGTVFRGDGRILTEIFQDGMTARDPAMSLEDHLAGGNGFIATSERKFVAEGFAIQHRGLIYEIDNVGGTKVKYPGKFWDMRSEREHYFTKIEPSQIRGAYETNGGKWIPNPNYEGQ